MDQAYHIAILGEEEKVPENLKGRFEKGKYSVSYVKPGKGEEAIETIRPDIFILPSISNFTEYATIIGKIQRLEGDKKIPLAAFVLPGEKEKVTGLIEAGMDDIFIEPVADQEVQNRISFLIRRATSDEPPHGDFFTGYFYRQTLNTINDGVAIVDTGGKILFHNPAAAEIFAVENLTGQNFFALLPKAMIASVKSKRKSPENDPSRYRVEIRTQSGTRKNISFSEKIFPHDPNLQVFTFRDVTKQKFLEKRLFESQSQYRMLVEDAIDGIFIVKNEKFDFVNKRFEEITGYSQKDLNGEPFTTILTPESIWKAERVYNRGFIRKQLAPQNMEITALCRDGTKVILDMSASIINYRGGRAIQGFIRDITKRKRLEQELLELNLELQRKNEALMDANEKLKGLDKMKSDFLSMATHELKTPITIIRGYNRMLLSESVGSISSQQREYLTEVKESCDRLINLINSMLDLSKIEAGIIEIKKFENDIITCIEDTCRRMQHLLEKNKLTLIQEFHKKIPLFFFDREMIGQVIMNLLGNALKFTGESGAITISAKTVTPDELMVNAIFKEEKESVFSGNNVKFVQVTVSDTGPGISDHQKAFIFEEFRQFTPPDGKKEGAGLGLAISRKIINSHDGKIWVESEEKKGSKFSFILPMKDNG